MALLSVSRLGKSFESSGSTLTVLSDVTFSADYGEVIVVRGSNGSGKTTLLNIVAGLEVPTEGGIVWAPPFLGRPTSYVFQNYSSSLLPWLNLGDNVLLPLRLEGLSRTARDARLTGMREVYDTTNIPMSRFPVQASGGQKQRACIARALLSASPVILLDEPFSALDEIGHKDLMAAIEVLRARERCLIVMVLHDLDDAILLADRVLVLGGRPTAVRADIRVGLSRPRAYEQKVTPEFAQLRRSVLEQPDVDI